MYVYYKMRLKVFKDYKDYRLLRQQETRLLAIQQEFLKKYFTEQEDNYKKLKVFFIYHGIGSGKTCTSITIAKAIMDLHPRMKTTVITPKRVQTNFQNELKTCPSTRDEYSTVKNDFKFLSFDDFLNIFKNTRAGTSTGTAVTNLRDVIHKFTENKIILIDEAHNLISRGIDPNLIKYIIDKNILIPDNISGGIRAVALRLLTRLAHPTCKIFLLSATPIFDNKKEFFELIFNLCPEIDDSSYIKRDDADLNRIAPNLKGKISYFKLETDATNDFIYPSVEEETHLIPLSNTQKRLKEQLDKEKQVSFYMKERQMVLATDNINKEEIEANGTPVRLDRYMNENAPKIKFLIDYINNDRNKGKHYVYISFIKKMDILISFLLKKGFVNFNELLKNREIATLIENKKFVELETKLNLLNPNGTNKRFLIYDTNISKYRYKQNLLDFMNSKNNITGNFIKIIIGTPLTKEGITFKHIQHFHLLDPVWNHSTLEQIEGRCIRFKSHEDITDEIKEREGLKRSVHKNIYVSTFGDGINKTADEKIMEIIENKRNIINKLLNIIKKYSIDYYLYKKTQEEINSISLKSKSSSVKLLSVKSNTSSSKEGTEEGTREASEEGTGEGTEEGTGEGTEEGKKTKGNLIKLLTCKNFKKGAIPNKDSSCNDDYKLGNYYNQPCCISPTTCRNQPKKLPNDIYICENQKYPELYKKFDAIPCCRKLQTEKKQTKSSHSSVRKNPKIKIPSSSKRRGRPPLKKLIEKEKPKRKPGRPRKITTASETAT